MKRERLVEIMNDQYDGDSETFNVEVAADLILDEIEKSNTLSPDSTGPEILAAQIRLGEGLTDITRIDHEGKTGVLFRPRTQHIPNGDPGELPAGEYWPVPGDVVLWVGPDGAQVAIDALAALTPSAPIAAPALDDGARNVLEELCDLMEATVSGEYVPDSFTTQPARKYLASLPAPAGDAPGETQAKFST